MKANDRSHRTLIEEGLHGWFIRDHYIRTYRLLGEFRVLPTISVHQLDNSVSLEFLCWGISNGLPF